VEVQARQDRVEHSKKFREWAAGEIGIDGLALNPASSVQLCTFLFGGSPNIKTKEPTEEVRVFKVAREEIPEDALEAFKGAAEVKEAKKSEEGE
jgi:DNA polymerase-1